MPSTSIWVRRFARVVALLGLMVLLQGCELFAQIVGTDPDTRQLKFSGKTGGEAGGTVTIHANRSFGPVRPFFQTGFLGDFSNDRSASFQNVSPPISATGTATISESWTIPLLAGVAFPTSSIGVNVPNLTAQVYGGGEITRHKAKFSLTEAGAPGGPATSASDEWTSLDPAVGGALLYKIGQVDGRPINFGPSVTVAWVNSHTVSARSANFAFQNYILDTGHHTDTRVMLNLTMAINSMIDVGVAGGAVW